MIEFLRDPAAGVIVTIIGMIVSAVVSIIIQPQLPRSSSMLRRIFITISLVIVILLISTAIIFVPRFIVISPTDPYDNYITQHGIMFGFDAEYTRNNPYEHTLNIDNVFQLLMFRLSKPKRAIPIAEDCQNE